MSNRPAMRSTPRMSYGVRFIGTAAVVIAVSVIVDGTFALRLGGSAAAEEAGAKAAPISLAGRWSGSYHGYGQGLDPHGSALTYDIVACKEGWCGIAVRNDQSCGAIDLHLAAQDGDAEGNFKGRLELVKGAAPYEVAAWSYKEEGSGNVTLHFVGATGGGLLMFRRSYPFEAYLTRSGDSVCTLDKATS